MTAANPAERPAIDQVFNDLKYDALLGVSEPLAAGGSPRSRVVTNIPGRKSSTRDSTGGRDTKDTGPADTAAPASRVRINLPTKKEDTKER
jgi:hypothetical protein